MNFAPVYLIYSFFLNIFNFLEHWYAYGFKFWIGLWLKNIQSLDKTFAVVINLKHFFVPLYKDYTLIGRFTGIILRFFRILIGFIIYLIITIIFGIIILVWWLIPIFLILVTLIKN